MKYGTTHRSCDDIHETVQDNSLILLNAVTVTTHIFDAHMTTETYMFET